MSEKTITGRQLHQLQQAIKLLNDYQMSEECYCERRRKAPSRYGHPPCLKCETRQILTHVEPIIMMKTEAQMALSLECDAMNIEFDDTIYHGRG